MINIIKEYFAEIIALLALLQPWFISLYKKYLNKGKIEVYETGNIEVGYSSFGTTIGLNGTLRCLNKDLFVRKMAVEIVRQRDNSTHILEWGIFRSAKTSFKGEIEGTFELPSGFLLNTNFPYRFNIQFHDMNLQDEIRSITTKISQEWNKSVADYTQMIMNNPAVRKQSEASDDPYWQLYDIFRKTPLYMEVYTKLGQLYYLDCGKYFMKLTIFTSNPDQIFENGWHFSINDEDSNMLRLNVLNMLDDLCGRRPTGAPYFFAYPNYNKQPS